MHRFGYAWRMTSKTPPPGTPVATGVASGSLGTGTAVDEDTTIMAVPEAPATVEQSQAAATAPTAASAPPAAAAPAAEGTTPPAIATHAAAAPSGASAPADAPVTTARRTSRRDPYRPIGIALAAILVALAGFAALSSGGDSPIDAGAPQDASQTLAPAATDDEDEGAGGDRDDRDGGGPKGNCNGRGNDPCDREGGGGD